MLYDMTCSCTFVTLCEWDMCNLKPREKTLAVQCKTLDIRDTCVKQMVLTYSGKIIK